MNSTLGKRKQQLIDKAIKEGGVIQLSYDNDLHFEYLQEILQGSNPLHKAELKTLKKTKLASLMEKERENLLQNRNENCNMCVRSKADEIEEGGDGYICGPNDTFYVTAPIQNNQKTKLNKKVVNLATEEQKDIVVLSRSIATFVEPKAGVVTNVELYDEETGKQIAATQNVKKECQEAITDVAGDYLKYMNKKTQTIIATATQIVVSEDENHNPTTQATFYASRTFTILGKEDTIESFTVTDPVIKQEHSGNEEVKVSYLRDSQVGTFDYSIENTPIDDDTIKLLLPVSFELITNKENCMPIGIDEDTGFRLYFDHPSGGQCYYAGTMDDITVNIDKNKMVVRLNQDWKTLLQFKGLKNAVSTDLDIYGQFNVKLLTYFGDVKVNSTVSLSFSSDQIVEDKCDKKVPKIFMQWGCVARDTLIHIVVNKKDILKRADEVQIGDLVKTEKGSFSEVKDVISGMEERIWKITTESRKEIQLTEDHPIFIQGEGWLPVKDIRLEQRIATETGFERVVGLDYISYNDMVFNFVLDETSGMYGNGFLIGDFDMQQSKRPIKKKEFSEKTMEIVNELEGVYEYE